MDQKCVFFLLKKLNSSEISLPPKKKKMPPFTHIEDKFKKHPNLLIFIQRRIKKMVKDVT
jgi:hypothetical protein